MPSLLPAGHVAAFASLARATSRAGRAARFLFLLTLLLAGGAPAVRAQAVLDSFDPNANWPIRAVVVQPDGKVLIGGDFTTLSPNGGPLVARSFIARLNADGTVDTGFQNLNPNGGIAAIALQADGKILVGGAFTIIGGQARNRIARLDATTGLPDSFNPNADSDVLSIVVQPDGKILAAGNFAHVGSQSRDYIARLDPVTGLADSFQSGVSGYVATMALQSDGKILIGGGFRQAQGGPGLHRYIARLLPTGLPDSFEPDPNGAVLSIALQPDGKILAGGDFYSIGGEIRNNIARLDSVTGLADSFNPGANGRVRSIAVQADGRILVGGDFTGIGGEIRNRMALLDPASGLAYSFDPNLDAFPYSIADPAGRQDLGRWSFRQRQRAAA